MPHRLQPSAGIEGLPAQARARAIWLPALAGFPVATWPLAGLLPVLDINGALIEALGHRRRFRAAPPIAGIFACDPFLRAADLAAALARAGIRQVVNFPTVQMFGPETAAVLGSVGYRAEAEFRFLLLLAERGIEAIACATTRGAADTALGLGLRRILLHPGLAPPADQAAWWAGLAGHVAIEGGEAWGWREPDQASSPSRSIRR